MKAAENCKSQGRSITLVFTMSGEISLLATTNPSLGVKKEGKGHGAFSQTVQTRVGAAGTEKGILDRD